MEVWLLTIAATLKALFDAKKTQQQIDIWTGALGPELLPN